MDQTQTEIALGLKKGSRGRKGRDGFEETIKAAPIHEAASDTMALYVKAELAKADYRAAVKALAERSGCNTANLAKLFKASASGKFEDVRRNVEQQSNLFEVVGEIAGGKVEA